MAVVRFSYIISSLSANSQQYQQHLETHQSLACSAPKSCCIRDSGICILTCSLGDSGCCSKLSGLLGIPCWPHRKVCCVLVYHRLSRVDFIIGSSRAEGVVGGGLWEGPAGLQGRRAGGNASWQVHLVILFLYGISAMMCFNCQRSQECCVENNNDA